MLRRNLVTWRLLTGSIKHKRGNPLSPGPSMLQANLFQSWKPAAGGSL